MTGADNSQLEICDGFSEYLSRNRENDSSAAATVDYQLVTLKLREYIYQKDLVNVLVYFARQQKALSDKGLFDDEMTKVLTSEDVKEMFMAYFFRGNGLDRLIHDPTDDNVKALETLGAVVFPRGDESELIKGALYFQAKKYDMAMVIFYKSLQEKTVSHSGKNDQRDNPADDGKKIGS